MVLTSVPLYGWITDGQNKFAKEKLVLAQLKRIK